MGVQSGRFFDQIQYVIKNTAESSIAKMQEHIAIPACGAAAEVGAAS